LRHMKTTTLSEISIDDIKSQYQPGNGRHWFDPETLRYFNGRLPQYGWTGPGGVYFVTSERYERSPRRYTVRQLVCPGHIRTVGQFNVLSKGAAVGMAKRMALSESVNETAVA
jgi:hypothetical protein